MRIEVFQDQNHLGTAIKSTSAVHVYGPTGSVIGTVGDLDAAAATLARRAQSPPASPEGDGGQKSTG